MDHLRLFTDRGRQDELAYHFLHACQLLGKHTQVGVRALLRVRVADGIFRFVVGYLRCWGQGLGIIIVTFLTTVETVLHRDELQWIIPERIHFMLQRKVKVLRIGAREARIVPRRYDIVVPRREKIRR